MDWCLPGAPSSLCVHWDQTQTHCDYKTTQLVPQCASQDQRVTHDLFLAHTTSCNAVFKHWVIMYEAYAPSRVLQVGPSCMCTINLSYVKHVDLHKRLASPNLRSIRCKACTSCPTICMAWILRAGCMCILTLCWTMHAEFHSLLSIYQRIRLLFYHLLFKSRNLHLKPSCTHNKTQYCVHFAFHGIHNVSWCTCLMTTQYIHTTLPRCWLPVYCDPVFENGASRCAERPCFNTVMRRCSQWQ